MEVAYTTGAEVGVGDSVTGAGVPVDVAPQATISTANKATDTTRIFGMALSALLRDFLDTLQVQHHIAAVMFATAGENLAGLTGVLHHSSAGGR